MIGICIVCRLGSKRLPNKAILDICGLPLIQRCMLQCQKTKYPVILTTTNNKEDKILVNYLLNDVIIFYGSYNNMAKRLFDVANRLSLDLIIKVNGDSPFISYEIICDMLENHLKGEYDYSFTKESPLGTRPEIMTIESLYELSKYSVMEEIGEYLSLFYQNNPDKFNVHEFKVREKYKNSDIRLNVDYIKDLKKSRKIYKLLGYENRYEAIDLSTIISFLKDNKEINDLNNGIIPIYEIDLKFKKYLAEKTRL